MPFVEVAAESGLNFNHENGLTGKFYIYEIAGSGCALFDFDGDGDLDIYLVQGQRMEVIRGQATSKDAQVASDRLFENGGLDPATQIPRFTDVTERAGIFAPSYGFGAAVGDYDNDGDVDLYITNFGENQLWRNNGDGTFTDVTAATGTGDGRWSTSAAFFDYDRDGWLDLYVVNYVDFSFERPVVCSLPNGLAEFCGPNEFEGQPDRLLHNRGDGTFEDVTVATGIFRERGNGLGVVTADFSGDGWPDLYVANDLDPNLLWINQGGTGFVNEALLAGCAFNMEGKAEASMGVDAADFDNDGDEDLFMTHLSNETNTLYVNGGSGSFTDKTFGTNLGQSSLEFTGFGTAMLDFDKDGWLDIIAANGAVYKIDRLLRQNDPFPYHERNQLFRNTGKGQFEDVTDKAGAAFELSEISRGVATGDLDNDGDPDVVITNNGGLARLLLNQSDRKKAWVGIRCLTADGKRDALGAKVGLKRSDGLVLWRRSRADASFCSANDPRVLFGLATEKGTGIVSVIWPDGKREQFEIQGWDKYHTLVQGKGTDWRTSDP